MRQLSLLLLLVTIVLSAIGQYQLALSSSIVRNIDTREKPDIKYTYKIVPSMQNTWGYNIFKNKKLLIQQNTIPGIPGFMGFKNKIDAEKVAGLVIEKLKKGEMPPSVNENELKKLNIFLNN
jgi:hypothetical protein